MKLGRILTISGLYYAGIAVGVGIAEACLVLVGGGTVCGVALGFWRYNDVEEKR